MSASDSATNAARGAEGSAGAMESSPRPRRQTAFYSPETPAQKKILSVPKGTGSRLRDIPSIWNEASKMRPDDPVLIDVHRILYKRAGVKTRRKREVGDFCGFKFKSDEKEMETGKLKERISHVRGLRKLVDFLDLPVKSGKDTMIDAIMAFLMKPKKAATATDEPPAPVPKKETPQTKKPSKKVTVSRKRKATREGPSRPEGTTAKRSSQTSSKKRKKRVGTKRDVDVKETDEEQQEEQKEEDVNADEVEQQGSTEAPGGDETTAPTSE